MKFQFYATFYIRVSGVNGVCVRREDSGVFGRVCVCVRARGCVHLCGCVLWMRHSDLGCLAEVGRHGGQ